MKLPTIPTSPMQMQRKAWTRQNLPQKTQQKNLLVTKNKNILNLKTNNNGYGAFAGIFGEWKNLITDNIENYNGAINLEPNSFQILESI